MADTARSLRNNNHQTPIRKKRIGDSNIDDDSSPEKKDCPETPGTAIVRRIEAISLATPGRTTRSQSGKKNQPWRDVIQLDNPAKKRLYIAPAEKTSESCSKSPGRSRPGKKRTPQKFEIAESDDSLQRERRRSRSRKIHTSPKFNPFEADENLQMEVDDDNELENQPPYGLSNGTPGRSLRIAPSTTGQANKAASLKVTPFKLKKDPNSKKYIVSKTPLKKLINPPDSALKKVPKTLEQLRSLLHTSEIPDTMPCREEEYKLINKFVLDSIKESSSSSAMYISGVPGTGKTATTLAVIKNLANRHTFKYVVVNAMELMEPKQLFVEIYKGIINSKKNISAANARKQLNCYFDLVDKKRPPVIIVIDELDMLCTKRQEIFYEIFNWTSCEEARVSVIAIANTLDLPERVMSQKVTSRLGTNRVIFQPYTYPQIEEIIRDRLSKAPHLVHKTAVEFVSKKVANISGDLRKAMDLLRRAIEIAVEQGEKEMLQFEHVNMAQKESAAAPRNVIGEGFSRHEFILFRAALSQVQSSGVDEFMFSELYKQYHILCTSLEGINPLHDYAIHHSLMELCSNRFLVASSGTNVQRRKIRLGLPVYEAQFIIKQVEDARKQGRITF